jgi:hypothetical protein
VPRRDDSRGRWRRSDDRPCLAPMSPARCDVRGQPSPWHGRQRRLWCG